MTTGTGATTTKSRVKKVVAAVAVILTATLVGVVGPAGMADAAPKVKYCSHWGWFAAPDTGEIYWGLIIEPC